MAGIGFELKKIIDKDGYFAATRAYFMSAIITVGPMILSVILFLIMQGLLKNFRESYDNIQLFNSIIIYSFLISYLGSSLINMLISRYISDCIYTKKLNKVFESLLGVIVIYSVIANIFINLIFINSSLNLYTKFSALIISILLGIMWIEITYLSAIKDYLKIVTVFIIGILAIIVGSNIFTNILKISPIYGTLISIVLGYSFISVAFLFILYKVFGIKDVRLRNCMDFMKSIDKYYELALIGLFIALGVYCSNIAIWFTKDADIVEGAFRTASFYDVPSFYAFLSIIPTIIMFTLKVETKIYPKYKEFYNFVMHSGNINEIKRAKKKLIDTVVLHIENMIIIQFIWSVLFIIIGFKILPKMGADNYSLSLLGRLIISALIYITMYFLIVMLLYFDRRKECLKISTIFLAVNIICAGLTLVIGKSFYGYGFFISSIISLIIAFKEINEFFNDIEYKTFALQPIFIDNKIGFFEKIYKTFV